MNILTKHELIQLLRLPLQKRIDQHAVEKWAASFWKLPKQEPVATNTNPPFVMMFPPPNITGNLHLGHALTAAVQDALIRQRRMNGIRTVWIPGFDHAGLATQNIVEKLLWTKKGLTRQEYGREKFVDLANEWKESKREEMRTQLNRMGLCLNHDKEYFTMDKNSSLAVQTAFKNLFNQGTIYRATKLVYWSDKLQTTLSDIEVEIRDGVTYYPRTDEVVKRRSVNQWFVDTSKMANRAVEVVQNSSIPIIPENYKNTWCAWLTDNGTEDWCISRQSWWGHRIPAYKLRSTLDEQQSWVVASSIEEAADKLSCTSIDEVIQDQDVLDTWFSSSLLPLTVSGWPNEEKFQSSKSSGLFPLSILETGFDILSYWVTKMVMISLALENVVPFKLILLHGMICDSEGKKMSKSRGNVIDPLQVIEGASLEKLQESSFEMQASGLLDPKQLHRVLKNQKRLFPAGVPVCGSDVLRAYLLSYDIQEEVVRIQVPQIDKIRRFSNKIWNIFRFVINVFTDTSFKKLSSYNIKQLDISRLEPEDKVVLERLAHCVKKSHESFNFDYQLQKSFTVVEYFLTVHFSTEYLTSIKTVLLDPKVDIAKRELKLHVLMICLMEATKLLHPFMPHLTEFLYQKMKLTLEEDDTLALSEPLCSSSYPSLECWEDH